ncbi:MAG: L-fucose:H+ symporter permease [Acidobacteriales bacterium]|nr:L-fucose:H+ symporter permease [Terriglobales bacterium]
MATVQTKSSGVRTTGSSNQSYAVPLAIVTSLFFMWGGITSLNDILVPHLKAIFDLTYAKVMMVQFAFFSGYFIFSLPSGKLIEFIGYKRAMVAGLFVMALGTILFIPAANLPSFSLFLAALLILAAGMTILQTSANPYVTALGKPETASSRLNLTQAFNSLGTTVFPKVGGLLILSGAVMAPEAMRQLSSDALRDYRVQQAASVKMPYLWLTIALVVLAGLIAISKLPTLSSLEQDPTDDEGLGSIWQHRQAVLGAIGIFTYVGAEVAIGSFLINYFGYLVGMDEKTASGYVSFYWGGAMVGRFVGSALLQRVRTGRLLMINACVAAVLVVVSMLTNAHVAMWSIILVGLFNSIMFPSIFTLGVDGLGRLTSKGSALLIAAIVGGAIIPVVQGAIADRMGIHHAFFIPVLCYVYIAYFAFDRLKAEQANPQAA